MTTFSSPRAVSGWIHGVPHGKADYLRRAVAAGDPARRQPAGRRGQGDARPQGPQRRPRQEVRFAHHHQGRRDGGQGDRPEGSAREHGRADGARGREQDVGHRRRRHHDRDRAGAGDLPRRREERRGRREPDGAQARHREGRRGDRRVAEEAESKPVKRQHDRPGRHHLGEQRRDDRHDHRRGDGEGRQGRRHHGRRGQDARDLARRRRGHAVRPRLPLALLRDRPRADGSRAREPGHPDPREEDQLDEGPAAGARAGGARAAGRC